jgi:hypothetical protein
MDHPNSGRSGARPARRTRLGRRLPPRRPRNGQRPARRPGFARRRHGRRERRRRRRLVGSSSAFAGSHQPVSYRCVADRIKWTGSDPDSRRYCSSRGSGRAAAPAIGSGRGRRGTRAPDPPPRPGYTSNPFTGSGTASGAATTAGSSRKRSRLSSSVNSSSMTTPHRCSCHSHRSTPLVTAASVRLSPWARRQLLAGTHHRRSRWTTNGPCARRYAEIGHITTSSRIRRYGR